MDNLGILIQAILSLKDTTDSKNQIAKELPKLESQLQSDKNTRVKIVAGLDVGKSKSLIQSQLNTLANQAKAPTIKVGIDTSGLNSTLNDVQNKIVATNNGLSIKPTVDGKVIEDTDVLIKTVVSKLQTLNTVDLKAFKDNLKNILGVSSKEISADADTLIQTLKLNPEDTNLIIQSYENLMDSIRNTMSSMGKDKIVSGSSFDNNLVTSIYKAATSFKETQAQALQTADNIANKTDSDMAKMEEQIRETTTVIKEQTKATKELKAVRDSITRDSNNKQISRTSVYEDKGFTRTEYRDENDKLTAYTDTTNYQKLEQQLAKIEEVRAKYNRLLADFKSSNSAIQSGLTQPIEQFEKVLNSLGKTSSINDVKNAFESLKQSASEITQYLETTNSSFNKATNAINNYKNMDNILKDMTASFDNLIVKPENMGKELDDVKAKLKSLQEIEKSEGFTENWAKQYREVNLEITRIRNNIKLAEQASKTNASEETKIQLQYLGELNKAYQQLISNKNKLASATNEDTKNAYTDEVKKSELLINNLTEEFNATGLVTKEIQNQIDVLKEKVALTDRINTNKANDKIQSDNLKAQEQAIRNYISLYDECETKISNTITKLNSLNNSTTFSKNASNPQVIKIKQDIADILSEYQKLSSALETTHTSEGLNKINEDLLKLNARFNDTTATAQRFEQSLKDDNGAEQLAQKVALLTSRIKAYRQANSKSEKLFGSQYDSMLSQLANPNIDLNTYNAINKQFQTMRQEINAANVAGKNLWQTLKEKVAKFTGWMSMTYAVSLFTRSIREAVTELKEVDTVLTEISKANDKLTDSQLAQIGSNSFGIASKYGKTATDYLTGVQEMSRAGYANAEAMGELSTAAQGAGDMTADVANQFIIAADKAYKMNGSVEELTKTLDGINYITNNNAVNMSELSEGFSIVSSTAASFGVRADELAAALGTMAATTQQSGSEVARAFRAILLNIRQVSDEEENIDAEGLTKYEKACNALGVSLKEVKDGVLQLRDPMQVLKELSIEYNKLSETDLKRTNLLNSVGGKLRSTQLDALLRQWSMYEEMLQQYEAGNGSMAREAEKTANSLEGRLNEFSNSWTNFINEFLDVDLLTSFVDSGERVINVLSDISSPLKFIITQVSNLLELVTKIADFAGGIPLLIGGIGLKNIGSPKTFGLVLNLPIIICVL